MAYIIDSPGGIDLSGEQIHSVADPTAPQDAATKAYVDALSQGFEVKSPVKAATTGDITLTGPQTVDSVALVDGDRVLVKNQTVGSENGIYVVRPAAWERAADADEDSEVNPGMYVFVSGGVPSAVNEDTQWVLTTDEPIVVGTTPLEFEQFGGAGSINAGDGLSKTGNTIDVNVDNSSIVINSDVLEVGAEGITEDKMSPGSVDLNSDTTDGILPVAKGGTGRNSTPTNTIPVGNGTGAQNATSVGEPAEVLRVPSAGGAPDFGAVDLDHPNSVEGVLPIEHGGTGGATSAEARANLGTTGKFEMPNLPGDTTVVPHALGTRAVAVEVYRNAAPYDKITCGVAHTTENSLTVTFASPKLANEFNIVVVG